MENLTSTPFSIRESVLCQYVYLDNRNERGPYGFSHSLSALLRRRTNLILANLGRVGRKVTAYLVLLS